MTKKKGRSKGGGHGGDNEDDDASTEDDPIVGMAKQFDQEGDQVNDKERPLKQFDVKRLVRLH